MTKYHVSEDGVARVCTAETPEACRVTLSNDGAVPHGEFATPKEAKAFAEKVNEDRFKAESAVRSKLAPGTKLLQFDGSDSGKMRRYGTSSSVAITDLSEDGKTVKVHLHVYDGYSAKMDAIIGTAVKELKKKGLVGEDKVAHFNITSKYTQGEIPAYDSEDENSTTSDGGKYIVEVGSFGSLSARVVLS